MNSRLRIVPVGLLSLATLVGQACGDLRAETFEGSFREVFEVGEAAKLEIVSDSGSIRIRGTETREVVVNGRIRVRSRRLSDSEAEQLVRDLESNPPIEATGSTVRVGERVGGARLRHASISYEVVVPVGTEIDAESDSGSQQIEGVVGPVRTSADSGSLEISGVDAAVTTSTDSGSQRLDAVAGAVRAEADSGSVEVRDAGAGVEVETDSGSIRLYGIRGEARAEADSGSITVEDLAGGFQGSADSGSIRVRQTAGGDVSVRTDSGGVELRTAPGAGYDFEIQTSSGSIGIDNPRAQTRLIRKRRAEGKIGEGGFAVDIHTGSGGVRLQ